MAIPTLTDEQVRTWTREQKDRWWLENVWRGDMPQLTLRSALTGFVLGGLLSATNLYVGAKTGWTLGVGITSVILAFAMFRVMSRLGAKDMTILENNCTQSIATAAGYMTGPLISGMAAYMWVQNEPMKWWHMMAFNVVLSLMGVLVAFPMKRRFINDEQHPFPEGRACGVVLDTLYTSQAAVGVFKAKALALAAVIAGFITFISGEAYQKYLQVKVMGMEKVWAVPHYLDGWIYKYFGSGAYIAGVDPRQMGLRLSLDLAMFGAGGLMGIRVALSMFIGMVINFFIIVPWMINIGEIKPQVDLATGVAKVTAAGEPVFGRAHILNTWALWWGISMMVVAAMTGLFAKPKLIISAFTNLFAGKRKNAGKVDVVRHIELPNWVSFVGVPVIGVFGVWMAHDWFGVSWVFGATAIPMIIVLTLIAANSTALTGITPTGSLSKIPQFIFGAAAPRHPPTNLMTGVMCVEVASNASNLLMDIKPGYMLGAKPRQQAIGHCIGVVSGALASTPLFYALFLPKYQPGQNVQEAMVTDQFGFPSALQWKGVSDLVTSIFDKDAGSIITTSAVISMIIAAVVGLAMELYRTFSKGRFPLSPLAIGLGVVVPPDSTIAMCAGAAFFYFMGKAFKKQPDSTGHRLWVGAYEPICAGVVAGAALIGIGDALVRAFLL
ncbi:MAG: OPT family oligopeptide transporter [Phycisphaerae bacterium]|nr:OPT family oligopeptide transporter [Phycisphaerae bacterium]